MLRSWTGYRTTAFQSWTRGCRGSPEWRMWPSWATRCCRKCRTDDPDADPDGPDSWRMRSRSTPDEANWTDSGLRRSSSPTTTRRWSGWKNTNQDFAQMKMTGGDLNPDQIGSGDAPDWDLFVGHSFALPTELQRRGTNRCFVISFICCEVLGKF